MARPFGSKNKVKKEKPLFTPKQASELAEIVDNGTTHVNVSKVFHNGKDVTDEYFRSTELLPNQILIKKDEDGNWSGTMNKNGTIIDSRAVSPENVLQYLLYHDGNIF